MALLEALLEQLEMHGARAHADEHGAAGRCSLCASNSVLCLMRLMCASACPVAAGALPDVLCCSLHKLALGLVQGRISALTVAAHRPHPLAAIVQAALSVPACAPVMAPAERQKQQHPLAAALARMPQAASAMSEEQKLSLSDRWLRWCCLDVLRVSVAGVLTHLLNNPQRAGEA